MPRPDLPIPLAARVLEYRKALATPWTYALHRNPYAMAGFLWGLPIPLFAVVLVQWASGQPLTPGCCLGRAVSHPVFLVLALHPFLFAVLFGAFGTVREWKERRILGLVAEMEALAVTDGLTGLVNQHHFHTLLVEAAKSSGAAVLLLDLDHLKPINDTHGHAQGDAALKHVANLIRGHVRPGEVGARAGGDEFAVLLKGKGLEAAVPLADRLRAEIAATPCPRTDGKGTLPLTVSIGVALVAPKAATAQEALAEADKALYKAKSSGRNRVETI